MNRLRGYVVVTILVVVVMLLLRSTHATPHVLLRAGHVPTGVETDLFHPMNEEGDVLHTLRTKHTSATRHQFLVQLEGPITTARREYVEQQTGVVLDKYLPTDAFLVVATEEEARTLRFTEGVRWLGYYHPPYKVPPELLAQTMPHVTGQRRSKSRDLPRALHVVLAEPTARDWTSRVKRTLPTSLTSIVDRIIPVSSQKASAVLRKGITHNELLPLVTWLAEQPETQWIQAREEHQTSNKFAKGLIQSGTAGSVPIFDMGINGESVLIGVGDSGLDHMGCFFHDEVDVPWYPATTTRKNDPPHRKIEGYWDYMDRKDYEGGHGSHVCGTIAGNAWSQAANHDALSPYNGMAFGARLLFTDLGCTDDGGCVCTSGEFATDECCPCTEFDGDKCPQDEHSVYAPSDLNECFFNWAYARGARLHSNSWGDESRGAYTANARELDTFVWNHEDFLPVFAASNSGEEGYYTIGSPGTAKNCLTVGASQNVREAFEEAVDYGNLISYVNMIREGMMEEICDSCDAGCDTEQNYGCQAAKNFKTIDNCCNDFGQKFAEYCCPDTLLEDIQKNPETYSDSWMADFSSRGPTMDMRIKPEVVTIGHKILSAFAHASDPDKVCLTHDAGSLDEFILSMSGTSMATPCATGHAALVREYFERGFYPSGSPTQGAERQPSAALVKAMLINSGVALTGRVDLDGKKNYVSLGPGASLSAWAEGTPSFVQGFGRVELDHILRSTTSDFKLYVDDQRDRTMQTGSTMDYCAVKPRGILKATLVWTDPPATLPAAKALVNDMDLRACSIDPVRGGREMRYGNARGTLDAQGMMTTKRDDVNNVEQITLDLSDAPRDYVSFRVVGQNVPQGPQGYALVITGQWERLEICLSFCEEAEGKETDHDDKDYTSEQVAGITIGASIGSLLLGSLLMFLWWKPRIRRGHPALPMEEGSGEFRRMDEEG